MRLLSDRYMVQPASVKRGDEIVETNRRRADGVIVREILVRQSNLDANAGVKRCS